MSEFFHPSTSNDRKRAIEEILEKFSQQKDCWKHSLYFLANTLNEYVMMYCLSVLETVINRRWLSIDSDEKLEIRTTLNQFLLSHHDKVPSFVRNKLIKLVVDVGRMDWPHFYPNFFTNILQLVQQPSTVVIGLLLIQTTSEELACPREDLSAARKQELHKLLIQQVPAVLNILNNILESTLEKHRSMVTATPPPSPTHGRSAARNQSVNSTSIISSSPVQSNLVGNLFKSPQSRVQLESLPPFDAAAHQICSLALSCLAHLFSWIPLSTTITPQLLSTIFHLAAFGCEANPSGGDTLGVLSMCCINELLSKNCVPTEFEDFLLQMFQQTFYLLQRLTKDSTTTSSGNRLAELNENYVEKFTEFLRLFVSIHLRRFESNQQFPVVDFLALLFKYTFKQPSIEGYYSCLDIWNVFLDYVSTKFDQRYGAETTRVITKYQEALLSLAGQILQKMQFKFNQSQLDEMDDETLDDDKHTEWQLFLCQNLETIAKIAELLPAETFSLLSQPFQEYLEIYLGLEQYVSTSNTGKRRFTIGAENDCRRLHCTLRDLSSLLQAVGRLADHLISEKFVPSFSNAKVLIEKLVHTAVYGSKTKLYEVASAAGEALRTDFIEVHAQALAAVKANTSWLAQFCVMARVHEEHLKDCNVMISSIVDTVLPLLAKDVPQKIVMSAARLFYSLCTTVRPVHLMELQAVQNFYAVASQQGTDGLENEVQLLMWRSLSHYLLLPWQGIQDSEQQWESRATSHQSFILGLFQDYQQLRNVPGLAENPALQEQANTVVHKRLEVLKDLVLSISYQGVTKSKHICYQSIQPIVQTSLYLFPIYIHHSGITEDMLSFFLALFEGLRAQMGVPFTEHIIQTFLSMFTREQLAQTIMQETTAGYKVVEKFLKILQLIVQEPGVAFRRLMPNVLTICMEQIYPIVAERPAPDIKPELYCLLHEFLTHNWQYFYKSNVIKTMQTGFVEQIDNEQHFMSIMQAYGQSFLQSDISIFKQNLESLEALNARWKLYRKKIFREVMLNQFLGVLLQVLVAKSHEILQEEIGITIYNMAAGDFDGFYGAFLPRFLSECEGLDANQKAILLGNFKVVKDLPSFASSIQRFVNDLRYYRQCNDSLAAGTVKFAN